MLVATALKDISKEDANEMAIVSRKHNAQLDVSKHLLLLVVESPCVLWNCMLVLVCETLEDGGSPWFFLVAHSCFGYRLGEEVYLLDMISMGHEAYSIELRHCHAHFRIIIVYCCTDIPTSHIVPIPVAVNRAICRCMYLYNVDSHKPQFYCASFKFPFQVLTTPSTTIYSFALFPYNLFFFSFF